MKRSFIHFAVWLFFIPFLITGCSPNQPDDGTRHEVPENLVSARVIDVIDGDTLKVNIDGGEETIRLLLVDTPEIHHPDEPIEPWGPKAKQFAEQVLSDQRIQLEMGEEKRGQYDRLLAYVYINGEMFNELLLRNGLARVAYIYPPNLKYVDEFRDVENYAQRKGMNIWSIEGYVTNVGFNKELVNK